VLRIVSVEFGTEGVSFVADALKECKRLEQLFMSQNEIGDSGASQIADALKVTSTGCQLHHR